MEFVAAGDVDEEGVHMLSTGQMLDYVEQHPDGEYIVATENGMLHALRQAAPGRAWSRPTGWPTAST